MTLNEYQELDMATAIFPTDMGVVYPAIGLAGETGEVAEKVKKMLRDHAGVLDDKMRHDIALELGDVMWYVAAMARALNYSLDDVARLNVEKINSRQQRHMLHGDGDNR